MRDTQMLDSIFDLRVNENAATFLIYSPVITDRLTYTCKFIFNTVLGVNFFCTSDLALRKTPGAYVINYSMESIPGSTQIIPHGLLFEKGVSGTQPVPVIKNEMIYFYESSIFTKENCFHFDVFSSVFYFISRYEEWQPFKKDVHDRFEAASGILFKNHFHLRPVVDIWCMELKNFLLLHDPEIIFPVKKMKVISTIDVDNLFAFKHKGSVRTLGAVLRDVLSAKFGNLNQRLKTLSGRVKDPFDIYEDVSGFCETNGIPLIWFFLMKTGTKYDRTVDPKSGAFKPVFEILKSKKSHLGLHPSYQSSGKDQVLKNEVSKMSEQLGNAVTLSRQHYLRFDIRETPTLLMKNGIIADFTMGFASVPGFRAGTSHPFNHYNFENEKEEVLLMVPFCAMDGAYFVYDKASPDKTLQSLLSLAEEIKKTGGFFITVFHERTFYDHLYPGFATLYKKLYESLKEF